MAASLRLASSRNSAGTPSAHQLVRMVVAHQLAVVRLDLVVGGVRARRSDIVGVAGVIDEARAEEAEFAVGEAEAPGDVSQERVLLRVQDAVGGGDIQQALEHVLQQLRSSLSSAAIWSA